MGHRSGGAALRTATPAAFGGPGDRFSATDLLAAALGSCIATDLAAIGGRHGIAPGDLRVEVGKTLSVRPKRLVALTVVVRTPPDVDGALRLRLERAARSSVVARSLAVEIRVTVSTPRGEAECWGRQ
ncbi:MAG TPA: OsmC family protein [Longimicrobiaceae bacterium]|nr:OsmC family protein [Longimicrobiaceae bacterium]